ncbi:hypothetical protein BRYFOR_09912 [Marvinbryantia formatexigens DSM 14469]|uniref:Uncharacterized protein n=1 Tax=Marvinbryantia formatexigens DSM 14469 TaxID=478749 RepID=C6LML1_9FIRM|nr:hypothetical protein BRYFOR_09912 [Marvinbryantia formatexigens DSM 14469]
MYSPAIRKISRGIFVIKRLIMAITVLRASCEQRMVYINGDIFKGSFRRNWERDYHCTPGEVRAMLQD